MQWSNKGNETFLLWQFFSGTHKHNVKQVGVPLLMHTFALRSATFGWTPSHTNILFHHVLWRMSILSWMARHKFKATNHSPVACTDQVQLTAFFNDSTIELYLNNLCWEICVLIIPSLQSSNLHVRKQIFRILTSLSTRKVPSSTFWLLF